MAFPGNSKSPYPLGFCFCNVSSHWHFTFFKPDLGLIQTPEFKSISCFSICKPKTGVQQMQKKFNVKIGPSPSSGSTPAFFIQILIHNTTKILPPSACCLFTICSGEDTVVSVGTMVYISKMYNFFLFFLSWLYFSLFLFIKCILI